jgi:hypothetical protein
VTTNEARKYFADAGLTYSDITPGDICGLIMMLSKHVKAACKEHKMSVDSMHISEKVKSRYKTNGTLIDCYITMNSHYFTRRECISFNVDGFIGFAGWADDRNTAPIVSAFCEWVDDMKEVAALE